MRSSIDYKFMQQQGFAVFSQEDSSFRVRALQFQPTIVGSLVLVAALLQSWQLYLGLSLILWLNILVPKANPFENTYNALFIRDPEKPKIQPAPGPRRFAQGMAAVFMLGAVVSILMHLTILAYVFEGFLLLAFGVLLFGKFCLGSYIYHLLQGDASFANATCPWSP